jgi:hypothetical protein
MHAANSPWQWQMKPPTTKQHHANKVASLVNSVSALTKVRPQPITGQIQDSHRILRQLSDHELCGFGVQFAAYRRAITTIQQLEQQTACFQTCEMMKTLLINRNATQTNNFAHLQQTPGYDLLQPGPIPLWIPDLENLLQTLRHPE